MRLPRLALVSNAILFSPALPVAAQQPAVVTAYQDAQVFDGTQFTLRTICVSEAEIVACPDTITHTVSLAGMYVTPPFGDAHTHHFDGAFTLPWHRAIAIQSGAFYAMTMTTPTTSTLRIRAQFSGPGNIDVATALGGITGPQSHPAEIYEALRLGIRSYDEQVANAGRIHASRAAADDAYFIVQTPHDVRTKMALLLESDPDHIKVYLRHSERFDEDWGKWGPGGGVDPELMPLIAESARGAGKRIAVATSSVFDYRQSLSANADVVTHLPCYQDTEDDPDGPYYDVATADECLLSGEDAASAARNGMASTLVVTEWVKPRSAKYVEWEKANIAHLREAGAIILIAVDAYGETLTDGIIAGVQEGYLGAAEILRIGTMDTPAFIFPDRRVGCLEVGCSASFIAFPHNPIDDISVVRTISFRLKDGQELRTDP